MDMEELIQKALGNSLLSEQVAQEVLGYGISAFLEAGCTYTQALNIIENARVNLERSVYQQQFGPRATIDEEGDAP
jgi:hypothetical protein